MSPQELERVLMQPDDSLHFSLEISLLWLADAAPGLAASLLSAPLRALQRMDAAVTLAQEALLQSSPNQCAPIPASSQLCTPRHRPVTGTFLSFGYHSRSTRRGLIHV